MPLRVRRGTNAERQTITPEQGELIYTTDTKKLYIGDGVNTGGLPVTGDPFLGLDNIVEDQSPELGGNLSMNNFDIVGNGNINTTGEITTNKLILQSGNGSGLGSNLIPVSNNSLTLGNAQKRFRNIYATTINVDGELNLASVNADIVGDDSTILIDSATSRITTSQLAQASATDGQILKWNQSNNRWQPATNSVALISDVDATNPTDGQILAYNSNTNTWVAQDNVSSGSGLIEGNTYNIDITGSIFRDDSSIMVNTQTGQITGDLKGSVFADDSTVLLDAISSTLNAETANINDTLTATNIVGTLVGAVVGPVTGDLVGQTVGLHRGDVIGSVFGRDSSAMVDADDQTMVANHITLDEVRSASNAVTITNPTGITEFRVETVNARSRLNVYVTAPDDVTDLSTYTGNYGVLNFGYRDTPNGFTVLNTIRGSDTDLRMAHDVNAGFLTDETKYFTAKDGVFGIGTYTPQAKLDVRGAIMPGVYADPAARDAAIPTPVAGMMVYLTSTNKHQGYNGTTWNDFY
jgi:hypothetical protein